MIVLQSHKSNAIKITMMLFTISMLSACGGGKSSASNDNTAQDTPAENAQWGFKWDDGNVWQ